MKKRDAEFYKGLFVSANVKRDENGVPLFGKVDGDRVEQMIHDRVCQLCGHKIGTRTWAVFPGSMALYKFQEAPLHVDCARYAAQVCPMILGKRDSFGFSVCKTWEWYECGPPLWLDSGAVPTYGRVSESDRLSLYMAHEVPFVEDEDGMHNCPRCGQNNLGKMNYDEFMEWSERIG